MVIKQISIFVENKKGRMAEIAKVIGDAGVDIRALSVADTTDFGILRLIVDQPDKAEAALREAGMAVSLTDVIAAGLEDTPGSFAGIMGIMSDADINIEYMYAFITRTEGKAYVIMRVENPREAVDVLQKQGIHVMDSAEIYNM